MTDTGIRIAGQLLQKNRSGLALGSQHASHTWVGIIPKDGEDAQRNRLVLGDPESQLGVPGNYIQPDGLRCGLMGSPRLQVPILASSESHKLFG
jgi:hypothetical protein